MSYSIAAGILGALIALQCSQEPKKTVPLKTIERIIESYTDSLLAIEGVVGVGQGEIDGSPCVVVFVAEDRESLKARIPKDIEGYAVRIDVTGEIKAR